MKRLTGKDGILRIYDSSAILHGTAPRDDATVDITTWDGATTWTDISANVKADDASYANNFLTDNDDAVFIGSTIPFCMIQYLKGGAADYAVGSGTLKAYYFNGTDFNTELAGVVDGTASGGDCFAQDGYIPFHAPKDWAIGADIINAELRGSAYIIKLMATTSPTTGPDADILCPCDGQFFEIAFAGMDFAGPLGRPLTEEILILDRNKMGSRAHYIEGADSPIYNPVPISFSCAIDDTYNKDDIAVVLEGGDPDSANWTATGVTSKGTTKNDGTNFNPAFADATKKALNVMIRWTGTTLNHGMAYYEVFFPKDQQTIQEAEDGIILTCNGGVYGLIEKIYHFGNRY